MPKLSRQRRIVSSLLATALLLLSQSILIAQKPAAAKSFIFYWGSLQTPLQYNAATDGYFGEIHTSLPEFQAALQREPRLWDGRTLLQQMRFRLDSLFVESDYYQPERYADLRPTLENYSAGLRSGQTILLSEIPVTAGKTALVTVFLSGNAPEWLLRSEYARPGRNAADHRISLRWGQESLEAHNRDFYTRREFLDLAANEPAVFKSGKAWTPAAWRLGLVDTYSGQRWTGNDHLPIQAQFDSLRQFFREGREVSLYVQDIDSLPKTSADTILLFDPVTGQESRQIIPGNGPRTGPFFDPEIRLANYLIVPEGDPRLNLRRDQRAGYSLNWGAFDQHIEGVYARSFRRADGMEVRADAVATFFNNKFTRPELIELLRQPARLRASNGTSEYFLQGKIHYRDAVYDLEGGWTVSELIARLERDLSPYEQLVVTGLQAGELDFSFIRIIFDVRSDDPKPPLRER